MAAMMYDSQPYPEADDDSPMAKALRYQRQQERNGQADEVSSPQARQLLKAKRNAQHKADNSSGLNEFYMEREPAAQLLVEEAVDAECASPQASQLRRSKANRQHKQSSSRSANVLPDAPSSSWPEESYYGDAAQMRRNSSSRSADQFFSQGPAAYRGAPAAGMQGHPSSHYGQGQWNSYMQDGGLAQSALDALATSQSPKAEAPRGREEPSSPQARDLMRSKRGHNHHSVDMPPQRIDNGIPQHELDAYCEGHSPTAEYVSRDEPSSPQARDLLRSKRGSHGRPSQDGTAAAAPLVSAGGIEGLPQHELDALGCGQSPYGHDPWHNQPSSPEAKYLMSCKRGSRHNKSDAMDDTALATWAPTQAAGGGPQYEQPPAQDDDCQSPLASQLRRSKVTRQHPEMESSLAAGFTMTGSGSRQQLQSPHPGLSQQELDAMMGGPAAGAGGWSKPGHRDRTSTSSSHGGGLPQAELNQLLSMREGSFGDSRVEEASSPLASQLRRRKPQSNQNQHQMNQLIQPTASDGADENSPMARDMLRAKRSSKQQQAGQQPYQQASLPQQQQQSGRNAPAVHATYSGGAGGVNGLSQAELDAFTSKVGQAPFGSRTIGMSQNMLDQISRSRSQSPMNYSASSTTASSVPRVGHHASPAQGYGWWEENGLEGGDSSPVARDLLRARRGNVNAR
eukprot:TRINITY_DN9105_c0_g1_i2.p1 TRINITY_DN9105_c0_g1~~TRINITY_DN9105_c0_g1_i2.p1  ORF type:complete len:681 (+),score=106.09 TRINITY_DN9105_c0_g1_i2:150-2192(+)